MAMPLDGAPASSGPERTVDVLVGTVRLPGYLTVPEPARGLVVFAHAGGGSRSNGGNRMITEHLGTLGLATLLNDLLTGEEAEDDLLVFDVGMLADRLLATVSWARAQPELSGLPLGFLATGSGTGAALMAAADLGDGIRAVVSRSGRPNLAGCWLEQVRAPTLLVVGGLDHELFELNLAAQSRLRCRNAFEVVPGASEGFDEPGALEALSKLAGRWFLFNFTPRGDASAFRRRPRRRSASPSPGAADGGRLLRR